MKMKFDSLLVLGSGIDRDGNLPPSALSKVDKAVELYKLELSKKVILSGKYAYNLEFTPPKSEARAMSEYAISCGISKDDIYIEDESYSTVSNICLVKSKIIEPNQMLRIGFIVNRPIQDRAEYNLRMVLGPKYSYELIYSNFSYPNDVYEKLEQSEKLKLNDCILFYKDVIPGDDKAIKRLSDEDLFKNYK